MADVFFDGKYADREIRLRMSTSRSKIPIGKILQNQGKITQDQLNQALALQQTTSEKLGRLLIDLGVVTEREVLAAYAQQLNVAIYDPGKTIPDPAVAKVIPDNVAQRYHIAPLRRNGKKLVVAMVDPTNIFALDDVRMITQFEIEPVLATLEDIAAIRNEHSMSKDIRPMPTQGAEPDMGKDIRAVQLTTIEPDLQKDAMSTPALNQVSGNMQQTVCPPAGWRKRNPTRKSTKCSSRFIARMPRGKRTGDEDSMELAEDAPIIRMTNVLIQNAIKQGRFGYSCRTGSATRAHPLSH